MYCQVKQGIYYIIGEKDGNEYPALFHIPDLLFVTDGKFQHNEKATITTKGRRCASVNNFKDKNLFLCGGDTKFEYASDVVDIYNIAANEWTTGPKLN